MMLRAGLLIPPAPLAAEPEPEPELGDRLQACSRFVALVAEQLKALQQGDSARLQELSRQRDELEQKLRELEAADPDGAAALRSLLPELLADGLSALESRMETDQQLREHWTGIQEGALRATRMLRSSRSRPGRYGEIGPATGQLDVRF